MKIRQTPTTSYFDERDLPSMGDPEHVESLVRKMLDEAKDVLFGAKNPQAAAAPLVEKWVKTLSPANTEFIQTLSPHSLAVFLRKRGLGTDDADDIAPVRALIAETISRFVEIATAYHEAKVSEAQLAFGIDAAVEDCQMMLRGLDNPAD